MNSFEQWLAEIGLENYVATFIENEIDFSVAGTLTEADLRELGLSLGARKKFLLAAAALAKPATANQDLGRVQPAEPSPEPISGQSPSGGERRQLTVMFCDLVGSTALSEKLDPEELRALLHDYRTRCGEVISRYEGFVARYVGDGILTYFGWPTAHEDDAERSIRAALEVVSAMTQASSIEKLAVRIGIATGPVVVGEQAGVGDQSKLAIGSTPNLAARLQSLAAVDQIVIASSTKRLLGHLFEFRDLGAHALKGIKEPIQAWQVTSVAQTEDRFSAARNAEYLTPLVGRKEEIALLMRRWEQAKDAEAQVVLISGEAGLGKSRVVHAVAELIKGAGAVAQVSLQCSPFHANSSYHPLIAYIERNAGLALGDSDDEKLNKLWAWLNKRVAASDADAKETVADLAAIFGFPGGDRFPMLPLGAARQKEKTLETLATCIIAEASNLPVMLILEDAQWADPSTLEALDAIVEQGRNSRLLVIVTFRSGFVNRWTNYPYVTLLPLGPLTHREAFAMAEQCTAESAIPPELLNEVVEKTDGVPLFIEEVSRGLVEVHHGHVADDTSKPYARLPIPATVQDALAARLDRLDIVSREIAQFAAVIGRDFKHDLIAAVCGLPAPELEQALTRLIESGFIHRTGIGAQRSYTFRHGLVQDLAYETLLKSRRHEMHRTIANQIESLFPHIANTQPEYVAHHYFQAGQFHHAAELWLRAANQAKARLALAEAASHARFGLDAINRSDATIGPASDLKRTLLTLLGDLESLLSRVDDANRYYRDAAKLATAPEQRHWIKNKLHHAKAVIRDNARIVYYEHGEGDETLLFVNPIAYALGTFQPIVERLCQDFRIVTVHCRGAGASDPLLRPYRVSQHVEDLQSVIRALGKPVVGVGISRGGNILATLSTKYPELIKKLVLVGLPLCDLMASNNPHPPADSYRRKRQELYDAQDLAALVRLHSELIFSEPVTKQMSEQSMRTVLALPSETVWSFFDIDSELDIRPILDRIAVPTLVAHGTDDQVAPIAHGLSASKQILNAQFYEFAGKGHLPMFTAVDEFCDLLRRFVHPNPYQ